MAEQHTLKPEEIKDEFAAWEVTSTRADAQRRGFTSFIQDTVRTPTGELMKRDVLKHPGSVGIIVLNRDGRVALLKQYRHPVRAKLLEPPAGLLEPGEQPLAAAQRELREEMNLVARRWRPLISFYTSPGILTETCDVFLAMDLTYVESDFERIEEEADMEVVWAKVGDVHAAIVAGQVSHPILISGMLALDNW